MQSTTNYGLNKPDITDFYNVNDMNENMDKIDTAIDNALSDAKSYTDTEIANLVGTAPATLNTLEEVAQAIEENEDVVTALNAAIGTKANITAVDEALATAKSYTDTSISQMPFKGYSGELYPGNQVVLSKLSETTGLIYVQLRALIVLQIGSVANVYSAYNNSGSGFNLAPVIVNQSGSHGTAFINSSNQLCLSNSNANSVVRYFVVYI